MKTTPELKKFFDSAEVTGNILYKINGLATAARFNFYELGPIADERQLAIVNAIDQICQVIEQLSEAEVERVCDVSREAGHIF